MESDFCYMVEKFLEYISVEKRYSENTQVSYRKDLEDFRVFVLETEGFDDLLRVRKKIIRNFMVHLSEQNLSKRSINRKLSALRSFYLYLLKIGEIQISPMETIKTLKVNVEKQIPFSEEEMIKLSESDFYNKNEKILEKLIIETLYQTGMRKSELCDLLLENVDLGRCEVRVKGKGNKERIVPISESLMMDFKNYILERNPLDEFKNYFFISKRGKKLNPKFVYSVVNSYFSSITSKQKKSPHILRHSFATHILDNGAEISKVKSILGHSSLASTQVYTHANIEQLKKVFSSSHPRVIRKDKDGESP